MKLIKTKKQLDKAFDNMEKGKTDLLIKVNPKNTRDNRIHKEGFDAGYKKGIIIGRKEMLEYISNHQGWEESRDFYAYHFGIRRQYKGGKPVGEK